MRIGILTLPLHTNYGGILQAYALQTVLERMGHEVVVFDTPNKKSLPPFWKIPLTFTKRTVLKFLGKNDRIFTEYYYNKTRPIIARNIQPFIDKYIHRKVIRSFYNLQSEDYDTIVVGSDQVWRLVYFPGLWLGQQIENAYLDFAKNWNVKRIVYAASFGTDKWEYNDEQTKKCGELLCKFDAVSTREINGIELCESKFNIRVRQVLDPTFLLKMEDYKELFIKANTPKSAGSLLYYVLDSTDKIQSLIKNISQEKHLVPFAVNNPYEYDDSRPLNERIKPSIETWLRGFYDAEFVVTDSFHACVFSILFKKQFIVVGNETRGMSRFNSLLNMFGLEDRLVAENSDIRLNNDIDYNLVYKKYSELKDASLDFLKQSLK